MVVFIICCNFVCHERWWEVMLYAGLKTAGLLFSLRHANWFSRILMLVMHDYSSPNIHICEDLHTYTTIYSVCLVWSTVYARWRLPLCLARVLTGAGF